MYRFFSKLQDRINKSFFLFSGDLREATNNKENSENDFDENSWKGSIYRGSRRQADDRPWQLPYREFFVLLLFLQVLLYG